MLDELNPPPADSPDVYGSVGHMNGAMDSPLPAEAYGGRDLDIPEGYMLTPRGVVPCIDGVEDQVGDVPAPLRIIDPRQWQDQPVPDRQWIVPGLVPLHNLTLLGGDGGFGKSTILMQLLAACPLEKRWLGLPTKRCGAFGFFCEDVEDELHRRMVDICRHYGVELADLWGLQLCSRVGLNNSLMEWKSAWEAGETTWLHTQILNHAVETGSQLVGLDSHHDVFTGEENWRKHGRQFCQGLREIATKIDGAVVMTAHPSLSGRSSGTGESGTTAWHNSVRSRLYITKANDQTDNCELILQHKKSNYGPESDEIRLRWDAGVFVEIAEETGMIGSIKRGNAETVFLICAIRRFILAAVKLRSRLFTALNLLPSIATLALVKRPSWRQSATNCAQTLRIAVPLSLRKSATVL